MRHAVPLALSLAFGCSTKGRTVRVAAAADLERAFAELGKAFETKTHITPVFTFDASGALAKKIDQGADYSLFASADKSYVDDVVKSGRCDLTTTRLYARGRIAVWFPNGVQAPTSLAGLADPRFKWIAIANPEHAPYGRAAEQALESAGVWGHLQGRTMFGDDVQATMKLAKSGAVDAAIVALSLAVVADGGTSLEIDLSTYDPLDQQLIVCGTGEEAAAAKQLADFIVSPEGCEVMTRYGFVMPVPK